MYNNDILGALTGNQPDLEKLIKDQTNTASTESVTSGPVPHAKRPESKPKQYVKARIHNNSVRRHK